ncbi:MAG: alpha/beta hydrolase, partial [Alphaproteobacteria bacterium]|nr:alpha/beta hydrolase [Alphaproteobacteria bacterium]
MNVKALRSFLLLAIGWAALAAPNAAGAADAVSFAASDGVQVFADYYSAGSKAKPLILLFHQAGSNRAEYAPIAPMLVARGFNALAIDQRSGGELWGHGNETVRHLGRSVGFNAALLDLEAALDWAKASGQTGPILAWGSSYSAALVFLLAAKHPQEITAVLAFSPGEYLNGSSSVRGAASQLAMPIFATSAKDADEEAQVKAILAAAPSAKKIQFVP